MRAVFLAGLALALPAWAQESTVLRDPSLAISRSVYEEKVRAIDREQAPQRAEIGSSYTDSLKALIKSFQEKGDLDPLLVVRSELDRFATAKTITASDVLQTPATVTQAQSVYLAAADKLDQDRRLKTATAARAYLDDLESLKRTLTRIGQIDSAVAVNGEIKRLKNDVDLSVLDRPAPAATLKSAETPRPTGQVAVNPTGARPPRDSIWITAMRGGFPAKNVTFVIVSGNSNRPEEQVTDGMGRITIRATPTTRYHALVVAKEYAPQEIKDATAGNAYQFTLGDASPGTGVVYANEREMELPGAGLVRVSYWHSGDASGPTLSAPHQVFRSPQQIGGSLNPSILVHYGEPFRIDDGDHEYEATPSQLGTGHAFYVRYTTIK